jgi:acyl carrier protein
MRHPAMLEAGEGSIRDGAMLACAGSHRKGARILCEIMCQFEKPKEPWAMPERPEERARARVVKLVREILERNGIVRTTPLGDELVDIGLSSIDLVNLMLAVEAEFDLMIPQSELTVENFRSISTVISLLHRLRAKAA